MHTRDKEIFVLNTLKISLAQTLQEGPFQVMFVGTQRTKEQKKLNTRKRKGQDATKITSAPAESCIQFLWSMMPISMTALTSMVKNIPNRNTIEDFTDEAGCIRQHRNVASVLGSYQPFAQCCAKFFQPGDHGGINSSVVVKSDRLSPDENRLREDYYFESLEFSRHTINLEFDEETMKPEKATEVRRNAGIDPGTMKMKQWYPAHDRVSDKSQWELPSDRVSDQTAPTGTDRASYHTREPIEDDDERLAMRPSDMHPPVPERVANPRIREHRAVQDFRQKTEKMHRATSEDAYSKAWFDYCRSVFPQSVRKAGPEVDFHNVSTYQCGTVFNNMGPCNRRSEHVQAEFFK